jgi:hypothetical protein
MMKYLLSICLILCSYSCVEEPLNARTKKPCCDDTTSTAVDTLALRVEHVIHELDSKQAVAKLDGLKVKSSSAKVEQLEKENKHLRDSIKELHEYFVSELK